MWENFVQKGQADMREMVNENEEGQPNDENDSPRAKSHTAFATVVAEQSTKATSENRNCDCYHYVQNQEREQERHTETYAHSTPMEVDLAIAVAMVTTPN